MQHFNENNGMIVLLNRSLDSVLYSQVEAMFSFNIHV